MNHPTPNRIALIVQALLSRLTRLILGPRVTALITETENGRLAVRPEDYGVGRQLRMNGKYGSDELSLIRSLLSRDNRVLIVGAHIGALAIPISKICKQVVAIEPNPNSFDLLELNLKLNCITNCVPINIAASDKDETIEFLMSRANSGGSKRAPKVDKFIYNYDRPQKIAVDAAILDSYLEERDFFAVIVDIEGSEYFALQGMQEILKRCAKLVVEFVPHHLKNVSGVTVEQFLAVISPHFTKLTIPSTHTVLRPHEFLTHLQLMYDSGRSDDGILFEKSP